MPSGYEFTEQLNLTWAGSESKNTLDGVTVTSGRSFEKKNHLQQEIKISYIRKDYNPILLKTIEIGLKSTTLQPKLSFKKTEICIYSDALLS